MIYLVVIAVVLLAIIFSFMAGFNFAIKHKAKEMIETMNMGSIIVDFTNDAEEPISCRFDKSPREMLNMDYILLDVKVRQ